MRATCLPDWVRPRVRVSSQVRRSACCGEEEQIRKVALLVGGLLSASLLANATLGVKLVRVQAREGAISASAGAATREGKAAETLPTPEDRAAILQLLTELRQVLQKLPVFRAQTANAADALAGAAAPASVDSADLSLVLSEVRKVQRELLACRPQTAGRIMFGHRSAILTRGPVASDPEIASVLSDRRASDSFWSDLESLLDARAVIGEARYFDLGLKMTEEYLQVDPSSAREFRRAALAVLESFGQARTAADAPDGDDPSGETTRVYQEQLGAISARLDPYLNAGFRHQQFKLNIERWAGHFSTPVEQ